MKKIKYAKLDDHCNRAGGQESNPGKGEELTLSILSCKKVCEFAPTIWIRQKFLTALVQIDFALLGCDVEVLDVPPGFFIALLCSLQAVVPAPYAMSTTQAFHKELGGGVATKTDNRCNFTWNFIRGYLCDPSFPLTVESCTRGAPHSAKYPEC